MKRLFLKILLLIPILIVMMATIRFGDPARLFKDKAYETGMAKLLQEGKGITNITDPNFDDRFFLKYYIDHLPEKKDVLVFGSSRGMQINSGMFPGKTLFNNGVSSATLEDYIAIYGLYRKKGYIPSIVVIAVDPWIFNKNNQFHKWQSLGDVYDEMLKTMSSQRGELKYHLTDIFPSKFLELVSPAYFQFSLASIHFRHWQAGKMNQSAAGYVETDHPINDKQTILTDGSRTWRKEDREMDVAAVRSKVLEDIGEDNQGALKGFVGLDGRYKQQIEDFFQLLKKDGVQVVLFLPPYHPVLYRYYLNGNGKFKIMSINKVEDYLRQIAEVYGFTVAGSYDPQKAGVREEEFYDGMHVRDVASIARIFRSVQ